MAIPKSTSVKALARMRAEREDFDRREREARRDAAIELGEAVLKSADLALEPARGRAADSGSDEAWLRGVAGAADAVIAITQGRCQWQSSQRRLTMSPEDRIAAAERRIQEIIADPAASYWLKSAARAAIAA